MNDSDRITHGQWNILIAGSIFTLLLVFILGVVVGKNLSLPGTDEETSAQMSKSSGSQPIDVASVPARTTTTSFQPHVPDENLSLYDSTQDAADTEKTTTTSTTKTVMVPFTHVMTPIPTPEEKAQPDSNHVYQDTDVDLFVLADEGFSIAYAVQVSSVTNRVYAETSVSKLLENNYPAYISDVRYRTGNINYRVRIGPYQHREAADYMHRKISGELKITPLVMTLKNGVL